MQLEFALPHNVMHIVQYLRPPWTPAQGLRVTQSAYFSILTHNEHILVTFCEKISGMGQDARTSYGRTDINVEIVT